MCCFLYRYKNGRPIELGYNVDYEDTSLIINTFEENHMGLFILYIYLLLLIVESSQQIISVTRFLEVTLKQP